ncbi:MAG: hypothetical protein WC939_01335 [Acholeplasmataceae bacterium]
MKIKDRLNSENRAIWNTLQYRYRNYIETEMMRRGDMSNDELNTQIKPLIIHYQKNYAPYKPKIYIKKKSAASKIARIRLYIDELKESLNENSGLDGKYAIYEQGAKDATKHTIERLLKIIGDEK